MLAQGLGSPVTQCLACSQWERIAAKLNCGRSAVQCLSRFQQLQPPESKPWSPEEMKQLRTSYTKYASRDLNLEGGQTANTRVCLIIRAQLWHSFLQNKSEKCLKNSCCSMSRILVLMGHSIHRAPSADGCFVFTKYYLKLDRRTVLHLFP